jgi:C_GCAxxG_C_C family probable redox protein
LALGLYDCDEDYDRLGRSCVAYYRDFVRRFGSTKCRDITGVRFKEGYDVRRFFVKGIKCLKVVYTSIESVFNMLETPAGRLASKHMYRIQLPFRTDQFQCAGAVVSRIERRLDLDLSSLLEVTGGFTGGIGFQGDVCGALMGGVLALGVVYGSELGRTHPATLFRAGLMAMKEGSRVFDDEHLHPSFRTSLRVGRLYRKFVSQFGSANCADILGQARRQKNRDFCDQVAEGTAQLALGLMNRKSERIPRSLLRG